MSVEQSLPREVTEKLIFEWMAASGPHSRGCSLVHDGSCLNVSVIKFLEVIKVGVVYYIPFHLIPFLLCLKNTRDAASRKELLLKTIKNLLKSLCFIGGLVTALRAGLCFLNKFPPYHFSGKTLPLITIPAGFTIFFETHSRREDIVLFLMVRSIRSMYILFKQRGWFNFANQMKVMFILIFGFISYICCEHPQYMKNKNIFESILGCT